MDFTNPLTLYLSIVGGLLALVLLILLVRFFVKPSPARDSFRMAVPFFLKARRNKKHHVFLGVSVHSRYLAAQILKEWKQEKKKKDQGGILMVNLSNSFDKTAERKMQEELGSRRIKLVGGSVPNADAPSLAKAVGLEKLQPWLSNERTSLYLFSDDKEENARLLTLTADDASIKAKVFHYASTPSEIDTLVAFFGHRVRSINPHQMAFSHIKLNCPQLMPVNFVSKAVDAQGKPLGYVEDGLHAWIVGFGHTGQEALRFLYEFGCFAGKDYRRAPTSFTVYDPDLDRQAGAFLQSAPFLKADDAFRWMAEPAGTVRFWQAFENDEKVNYVVVAVDEGPRNIELGVGLLQAALRCGRDLSRLAILVRNVKDNRQVRELIDFSNKAYCPEGTKVLYGFGDVRTIWNADVISGRKLKKASHTNPEEWEKRKASLSGSGIPERMQLRRLQAEDISRVLYAPTLKALAPEGEPGKELMKHLSAQEHLHWMSALAVTGYVNGPLDELRRQHPKMVPYPDIPDEKVKG